MTWCHQIPDGDGYRCEACGWTYHKRARRYCPASPGGRAGKLLAIVQTVTAGRDNKMDWHLYGPRDPADLEKIIGICLDCEDHDGKICRKARRSCTWLKSLGCVGFRECGRWSDDGKTSRRGGVD